ncbi:alpha/beta fold hydrolase [Paraburkholderia sp. ZP32-5]|uniref:alpha/beta fold hydrolase n=1 Tax=Paraburkholderia sp. ZP32-5 TaxID=2883245 RepID=UPI001F161C8E|nr:alpha/beta hydrolase [Paraburkholderia sp. ZP32-5]
MADTALQPTGFEEHRVPRSYHTLYAREYPGEGPAFVLMHGFPDNLRIYERLGPVLSSLGRRAICFDFLGYGLSDKPESYNYTTSGLLEDIDAIVAHFKLEQFVPVGHDASGCTAINWALDHKSSVSGVALLNMFYGDSPTLRFPPFVGFFSEPKYRDVQKAMIADLPIFGWLQKFTGNQFCKGGTEQQVADHEGCIASAVREQFMRQPNPAPAFLALTGELLESVRYNTSRTPELARFDKPVSLIWGDRDPYLTIDVARHLRTQFGSARLHELASQGHWPQVDVPETVARHLIEDFPA